MFTYRCRGCKREFSSQDRRGCLDPHKCPYCLNYMDGGQKQYCPSCKKECCTTCCACGCGNCLECSYRFVCITLSKDEMYKLSRPIEIIRNWNQIIDKELLDSFYTRPEILKGILDNENAIPYG